MKNKVVTAEEAVALVRDGDTLINTGFIGSGAPEALLVALERRFVETGSPRNLTLMFAAGQGDSEERGLNRLGQDGLLKRVIGGHWGLIPKVAKLALANRIEGWNLPQGVISQLYRAIAGRKPGVITKVGLGTFVDPRARAARSTRSAPRTWSRCCSSRARNGCSTRRSRSTSRSVAAPPPTPTATSPWSGRR